MVRRVSETSAGSGFPSRLAGSSGRGSVSWKAVVSKTYSDGVARTVQNIAEAQRLPTEDLKAVIIGQNQTSLLERFIEPDEIASLAVYLSSPLSSATNGAAVRADGGVLTTML